MKRVVNAMLSSIPSIMNVFLVCSLILLIFGILGVNFFKGRLYYCDMSAFSLEQMSRLEAVYGFSRISFKQLFSKAQCEAEGGTWLLRRRNYNNVLKSAMTLFELATTEGWVDIMYEGVDATDIGYHPVENYNRSYVVFFIGTIRCTVCLDTVFSHSFDRSSANSCVVLFDLQHSSSSGASSR